MKKWLIGIIALFVLFCIYWAAGRTVMVNTLTAEIQDLEANGYKVDHKGLAVGGFPLQFRGSLIEPDLAAPRSAEKPWSIKSERLSFQASAFNPLRWSVRHRGDARLDLRGPKGERWLFDVRPFTVNIEAKAGISGKLKTFKATLFRPKSQAVIGTLPPIIAMDSGTLSAAPNGQDMRVSLKLENIFLEQNTLKDLQRAFGPKIEHLDIKVTAIDLITLDNKAIELWQKKRAAHLRGLADHMGRSRVSRRMRSRPIRERASRHDPRRGRKYLPPDQNTAIRQYHNIRPSQNYGPRDFSPARQRRRTTGSEYQYTGWIPDLVRAEGLGILNSLDILHVTEYVML